MITLYAITGLALSMLFLSQAQTIKHIIKNWHEVNYVIQVLFYVCAITGMALFLSWGQGKLF